MPQRICFLQLPSFQPTPFSAALSTHFAAGTLVGELASIDPTRQLFDVSIVDPGNCRQMGDRQLVEYLCTLPFSILACTLYLWNIERSLWLVDQIKRRRPEIIVIVGGPEVTVDNILLRECSAVDVAVSGEGEPFFAALAAMRLTVKQKSPGERTIWWHDRIHDDFYRNRSPYLAGIIEAKNDQAVFLEMTRGCRSSCTFCYYSKGRHRIRQRPLTAVVEEVEDLLDLGYSDFIVTDPNLNDRDDFVSLLGEFTRIRKEREFSIFAELRAEGVEAAHVPLIASAGFGRIELGLQTFNRATLKKIRRGGNPDKVIELARRLLDFGVDPVIDMIIGLPGDCRDDLLSGVGRIVDEGLEKHLQIMPLYGLPGTEMRRTAPQLGLNFDLHPPYKLIESQTMSAEEMVLIYDDLDSLLGCTIDEMPYPCLVIHGQGEEPWATVYEFALDSPRERLLKMNSVGGLNHQTLYFRDGDLFERRDLIRSLIETRTKVDPFAVLDIVLSFDRMYPLDLIDRLLALLPELPQNYANRILRHRDIDAGRRFYATVKEETAFDREYLIELNEMIPVYLVVTIEQGMLRCDNQEFLLSVLVDEPAEPDDPRIRRMARIDDPYRVAFTHQKIQRWWCENILRGDAFLF